MCGIAGTFRFNDEPDEQSDRQLIESSLHELKHRGPDAHGIISLKTCTLGHARLKILDLSENASQPMSDSSGHYHLVFNGEIFNHHELRSELIELGFRFKSRSDTEVLLNGLIHFGESFLDRINGFFAFAFYDSNEQRMMIARDRFGEKPLYYNTDEKGIRFASELKGLEQITGSHVVDPVSLAFLLQFTYIPAPSTILNDVKKLDPGFLLRVSSEGVSKMKWYKPNNAGIKNNDINHHDQFRKLLSSSVKMRMDADVPVGVFLSGGADSSVIALLSAQHNQSITTYSVSFPEENYFDESKYAKSVAEHIGLKNEIIPLTEEDMLRELMDIIEKGDEPFADSSAIAFGALSRQVSGKVKVALTGDGADELLGGYHKHQALLASSERNLSNQLIAALSPFLKILPASRNNVVMNRIRQLRKYSSILQDDIKERYVKLASWSAHSTCEKLLQQDISLRFGARINTFIQDVDTRDLNTILFADQHMVLANDMLVKSDRMSMRHGLEIRSPFLDYRIVEFLNALPIDEKLKRNQRKIILRETFAKDLPNHVFNRTKRGFEIPLEKWLRGKLRPIVEETLSEKKLKSASLLDSTRVSERMRDFYRYHQSEHTYLLYSLLLFELWYDKHNKAGLILPHVS